MIENGAGYDDFIGQAAQHQLQPQPRRAHPRPVRGRDGTNPNPHLWYSPDYVTRAARAHREPPGRRTIRPTRRTFAANLQTFLTAYQPYVDTLATIRAKYAGSPIAYTERVPGYLVQAAGLRLATPASFAQAIEDGNDPSPADTAAMDAAVSQRQVKVLLYNAQVTSPTTKHVRDLATAAGVPVVGVAETIPAGEPTFQTWQLDQARAILAALGG